MAHFASDVVPLQPYAIFYTATVKPKRLEPALLYNTSLRKPHRSDAKTLLLRSFCCILVYEIFERWPGYKIIDQNVAGGSQNSDISSFL